MNTWEQKLAKRGEESQSEHGLALTMARPKNDGRKWVGSVATDSDK
jgi:hypothetical protein